MPLGPRTHLAASRAHGGKVDAIANNGATVVDLANGPRQRIQPYPETIALLEMLGAKNSHKCVSC